MGWEWDNLEELNPRLWRWIESEYHQRPHSALEGQTASERLAQRALNLRTADAQTDWEALFLSRAQRRVRLDATFGLESPLWAAPVHLRGQLIHVRFDPFAWRREEIWWNDKYVGPARRCDKQLNSKTYTDRDYERPDKSAGPGHRSQKPVGRQLGRDALPRRPYYAGSASGRSRSGTITLHPSPFSSPNRLLPRARQLAEYARAAVPAAPLFEPQRYHAERDL